MIDFSENEERTLYILIYKECFEILLFYYSKTSSYTWKSGGILDNTDKLSRLANEFAPLTRPALADVQSGWSACSCVQYRNEAKLTFTEKSNTGQGGGFHLHSSV